MALQELLLVRHGESVGNVAATAAELAGAEAEPEALPEDEDWRGEQGNVAAMTLVWGRPLTDGGAVVTAELADLTVDQCTLLENRFTLIAPDDYRGDTLDVKLWDARGTELAAESLYE